MSRFLDIALRNAARGFPVTPLHGKAAFVLDWPHTASADEQQIRTWARLYPSCNCGVVFGGEFVGLDSDCVDRLMALCGHPEWFATYSVSSGRPNRAHWYYLATDEVLAFGNRAFSETKDETIFEVKAAGALLVAEGSVHPDTGATYSIVQDLPLIPFPAGLLEVLKGLKKTAEKTTSGTVVSVNDFKLERLRGFLAHYEIAEKAEPTPTANGWRIDIECPWVDEHSGESPRETSVFWSPVYGFGFKCFHGHCDGRNWPTLRQEMEKRFPNKPRFFGKLPPMSHADIGRYFVESTDDFVAVYDLPDRPIGCWVGTRWDICYDTHLLRRAVRDCLDELFRRYPEPPEPEEGKKAPVDYRLRLKTAMFADSVLREARELLPAVRCDAFDINPHLLGLPTGFVAELATGTIRRLTREDALTRRINVMPVKMATERFDRFLLEITQHNGELVTFLLELMALCLIGEPTQLLFFLWGRGRNGKGCWVRLLAKLLGPFFCDLRTNELTTKVGGDAEKRTIDKFRGARAAAPGEAVGHHLNFALLKILSGGDRLTGARMRQDETSFFPTHKLLLPTNDRPELPADAAMRGRVRLIEFNADFSDPEKQDRQLESTLEAELPGILYKLLGIVPDVIRNGLSMPKCVMTATSELFEGLDILQQWFDDCAEFVEGGSETRAAIAESMDEWQSGNAGGTAVATEYGQHQIENMLNELKHKPGVSYKRGPRLPDGTRPYYYFGVKLVKKT